MGNIVDTDLEWLRRTISPVIKQLGMELFSLSATNWDNSDYEFAVQAACIHPDNQNDWHYEYFIVRAEFANLAFAEVRRVVKCQHLIDGAIPQGMANKGASHGVDV